MADRPILFSAPMVRALIDGRKTQTRRILKPQPGGGYMAWQDEATGDWFTSGHGEAGDWGPLAVRFAKGDRLWVRETFSGLHGYSGCPPRGWHPDDLIWRWADGNPTEGDWTKPKPGIHMPRWASRLTLTVTDVRVQRLQEISEQDAKAEGTGAEFMAHRMAFEAIWRTINGNDAWDANPWVAAVSFTVERRNIDAVTP